MSLQNLIIQSNNTLREETSIEVNVVGSLTGTNSIKFISFIQNQIQYKHVDLVVDLTGVDSIDSRGIDSLSNIYRIQKNKNCDVVFIQSHESKMMSSIRPTSMHKVLPFNYNVIRTAS